MDIARSNAYLTRRMVIDTSRDRDPHITFLTELVSELFSVRWKYAPSNGRMAFGSSVADEMIATPLPAQRVLNDKCAHQANGLCCYVLKANAQEQRQKEARVSCMSLRRKVPD